MEHALEKIGRLLEAAGTDYGCFPPTLLFEEGWMLRLVLDWFATSNVSGHTLSFDGASTWYSEALLPSTFLSRYRGDKYAEGFTHADGAIGHIAVATSGQTDLSLKPEATILKVVEAKMFSPLSRGTTHARQYNQAARNVACMAEVLQRANRAPDCFEQLGFYVLAPNQQIEDRVFDRYMSARSIRAVVEERVANYDEPKTAWFNGWFLPMLQQVKVECISWEGVLEFISVHDRNASGGLSEFYSQCLKYNPRRQSISLDVTSHD